MDLINFRTDQDLELLRMVMGADLVEWNAWNWEAKRAETVREQLSTQRGIELEEGLDEIETDDDGTFSYEGEKVLLYIRDQYHSNDQNREYKFHICSCPTMKSMVRQGRKNRYVVTKNTSEKFYVCRIEGGEVVEEGREKMNVCKLCLQDLSYKGYGRHGSRRSKRIYEEFSLEEFFDLYGETKFTEKPDYSEYTAPSNTYPDNFGEISRRYREKQGWTCEECGLDLSGDEQWLHTHHKNYQRNDNRDSNLKALCLRCHAEEHPRLKSNEEFRKFTSRYNSRPSTDGAR